MLRSILSVVAGYAVWTMIFLGGNASISTLMSDAFQSGKVTNTLAIVLLLLSSCLASLAGGYTTALVAGQRPLFHAAFLSGCLLATGIPVQIWNWEVLPPWYHVSFLLLLIPVPLAGAKFFKPRERRVTIEGDF